MSKLSMAFAGATGFLLGSRAGREPYVRTVAMARRFMQDPQVRRGAAEAQAVTVDKAHEATAAAKAAARDATDATRGAGSGFGVATP
jgi:hypothetical protein